VESKRQQKGSAVNNTIEIFGLVIEPVHFSALTAVTVIGAAARALWHLRAIRQEAKGKAFDRFMATRTLVTESGGKKLITLRNAIEPSRLEDHVRGAQLRKDMVRRAAYCTVNQPFLLMDNPEAQVKMLHAVRNALTVLNRDGEAAEEAGLPVIKTPVRFSVTAADASGDAVRMIRVQIMNDERLKHFRNADKDSPVWSFESGQKSHRTRIGTLAVMAAAYFDNGGMMKDDKGRQFQIVETFELKVPNYTADLSYEVVRNLTQDALRRQEKSRTGA
jgi:hypothetical protein